LEWEIKKEDGKSFDVEGWENLSRGLRLTLMYSCDFAYLVEKGAAENRAKGRKAGAENNPRGRDFSARP